MNEITSAEQSQLHNINATPRFVEPQVHPDIDSYFREKIARATAVKLRNDKSKVRGTENWYPVGQGRINLEDIAKVALEGTSPEAEIQRLQGVWNAVGRGDFVAASDEVAQDIADITNEINERRQSTDPAVQRDVMVYDNLVANIAEWQAGLQETSVDPSTRLGKQINRTVVQLIQQRDMTGMGRLHQELRPLQKAQKAIATLPNQTQR